MNDNPRPLYLLGAGDSWAAELEDVANLHGYRCFWVPIRGFTNQDQSTSESETELEGVPLDADVFLAFQIHPSVKEENHAVKVQFSRRKLLEVLSSRNQKWINLIRPTAWISPSVEIGEDSFIGANSSVGANTKIGSHCTINRNVSIGHDVHVGEGVEISPNASISSGSSLGNWVFIGPGAVLLNDIEVGQGAVIAAGSVVTKNVFAGQVVFGVPAKPRI